MNMVNLQNTPNVLELMRHHALSRADHEAVTLVQDIENDEAVTLSYRQLDTAARELAGWLQARFSTGERILLLYPVGLDFTVAFMACIYAGMIAVPAPLPGQYRHERHRVKSIAVDAGVSAIFTDQDNLEKVKTWGNEEGLSSCTYLATDQPIESDATWHAPQIDRQTVVLLQYTSGSTGEPKGVMITHQNLLHNVDSYRQALGFDENTRFGGWIPLFHDMGLMAQLLPALFLGSSCVLMTPQAFVLRPYSWLRMIDKHDIHYSAAPNFAFDLCCRRVTDEQLSRLDLSRWAFATNGSEPIQAATLKGFSTRFALAGFNAETLCPCYGMAEATVYVSGYGKRGPLIQNVDLQALANKRFELARDGQPSRQLVSCGVPVGFDVRIVCPSSHVALAADQFGEIWLRSDSVSPGYWHKDAATQATFNLTTADGESGFMRTGDLGVVHEGELYVCGRIKEMLIVRGRNLYPQDIEFELRRHHPELASRLGSAFGVMLEGGEALVVTHEVRGLPNTEKLISLSQAIRGTVMREFGIYAVGVTLLRSGSVRRTTSGKIQRGAMRELFLANELPALYESLDATVQELRLMQAKNGLIAQDLTMAGESA
ncbi:fatty acyl-AMP ligase [Pseudomonas mandelii]|uniref:Fatty acyl-AMP ligase n=2 Tax=Pseudomonas mandelii TaxID=75612 RepID=A0A502I8A5_9PSED|nr:fatty acyl-AMP ligase [Pseudomonas mandelii]